MGDDAMAGQPGALLVVSENRTVDLNTPQRPKKPGGATGKGFVPGKSGNPGGQSKEKRAFLDRLRTEDADEVYAALMDGVRQREWSVVLRAAEYIAGKPPAAVEDRGALADALTVVVQELRVGADGKAVKP